MRMRITRPRFRVTEVGISFNALMKLSTYLLGCLTISQLTNGVVLQQETGSSDFLDTQRALDQGNEVSSVDGIMSGIAYPANQPYGPALPD
ncbi:hypothetical protein FOZ60_001035, partial [Perkinsus olseni]